MEENIVVVEDKKVQTPSWKGCIILGIINIIGVFLCTALNLMLVSTPMIILIIVGVGVSISSIKEDYLAGFKISVIGCAIGLLLNLFAGALYVFKILSGVIALFLQLGR